MSADLPEGWIASNKAHCRSCRAEVIWAVFEKSGKRSPFNLDGVSHFATCEFAARHRNPKGDGKGIVRFRSDLPKGTTKGTKGT